jgi:integrase/recombinase XerD
MRRSSRSKSGSRFDAVERVWRDNRCLKHSSIVVYRRWILRFKAYCHAKQLEERAQLTLVGVSRFARWYACAHDIEEKTAFSSARSALGTWALARQTLGESLPPWRLVQDAERSRSPLIREFAEHLHLHRGNPTSTVRKKIAHVAHFLAFLREQGRGQQQIRLQDIDAFVSICGKRYARTTVADICSSLRGFMRFLRVSGRITVDLASSILAPIVRRHEHPHRALSWDDVQRILCAVDRRSACGRRDYALLLLMSSYGLGAGEVIRLTLEDIDWRAATLHVVRPKTHVEFVLPLLPAVAQALASYLRHGRPRHARSRHVFVTMRAPYKPLACAVSIRHILHTHAHRAGVTAPYLGTHVLRHTYACRQMELGAQPKVIGDILGHRDPDSTSAYLRVATEHLRDLALPVPS